MGTNFHELFLKEKRIRAGFIGCGSHALRNVYPVLQFVPVELVAVCDLSVEKASVFARQFGAKKAYSDYKEMLKKEQLDAVFVVTSYDEIGRPRYPQIVTDCLQAGVHAWIEKPPAGSTQEIDQMMEASKRTGKIVVVGLKKMFAPANEKAKELSEQEDFGRVSLTLLRYPEAIPVQSQFEEYFGMTQNNQVLSFLDHLCHPISLLLFLRGMPNRLYYERSANGSGVATFSYDSGEIASLVLAAGASYNGGMEHTIIVSDKGRHIIVDNNIRLSYHKNPPHGRYGNEPDFFTGTCEQTTSVWEPEFSLGQLYNKALFLLGYYNEVAEFCHAILENRSNTKGTLEQARQLTHIFEKFAEGPGKTILL